MNASHRKFRIAPAVEGLDARDLPSAGLAGALGHIQALSLHSVSGVGGSGLNITIVGRSADGDAIIHGYGDGVVSRIGPYQIDYTLVFHPHKGNLLDKVLDKLTRTQVSDGAGTGTMTANGGTINISVTQQGTGLKGNSPDLKQIDVKLDSGTGSFSGIKGDLILIPQNGNIDTHGHTNK